jgi:hypothetical protein
MTPQGIRPHYGLVVRIECWHVATRVRILDRSASIHLDMDVNPSAVSILGMDMCAV